MILKSSRYKLFSVILIFCLGTIVYSNSFLTLFQFDDWINITNNFAVRNIFNLHNIWTFLPRRFLLYLSLAFNYHVNGYHELGYHIFNLIIHLCCASLVWWLTLLTFLTPAMREEKISRHANAIALLAGLVFVSHPIQIEAVTYIVQRAASMATLFYLASLCFYVQSRLLQGIDPRQGEGSFAQKSYYIGALVMAILAMFTKETAITLPLMILLYEFSFLKEKGSVNWKYLAPFLATIFIIPVTMLLTETRTTRLQQLENEPGISWIHYLLTQFRVMVTYIRLLFLPVNQNIDYDYPVYRNILELPVLASLVLLSTILFSANRLFLKYRLISFGIFWFFLALLPESSFLPIKDVIFEHRLYLPMVGFSIFLVSALYYLLEKSSFKVLVISILVIITGYSVLTYQRNLVWKDGFTLWGDAVRKSPHKARPYLSLGYCYYTKGNFTQCILNYNKAIALDPKYAEAYNDLGVAYYAQGKFPQALENLDKAIALYPSYAKAYLDRGILYYAQGKLDEAVLDFNKALTTSSDVTVAYNVLKIKFDVVRIIYYTKAIRLNPKNAIAYFERGNIYKNEGNIPKAMLDFNTAIGINPQYAVVYNARSTIYLNQGELAKAMSDCNKAIEIDPANAQAYTSQGLIYAKLGNFNQAVLEYSKAIAIDPKDVLAYKYRAFSYDKLMEYGKVLEDVRKAQDLWKASQH